MDTGYGEGNTRRPRRNGRASGWSLRGAVGKLRRRASLADGVSLPKQRPVRDRRPAGCAPNGQYIPRRPSGASGTPLGVLLRAFLLEDSAGDNRGQSGNHRSHHQAITKLGIEDPMAQQDTDASQREEVDSDPKGMAGVLADQYICPIHGSHKPMGIRCPLYVTSKRPFADPIHIRWNTTTECPQNTAWQVVDKRFSYPPHPRGSRFLSACRGGRSPPPPMRRGAIGWSGRTRPDQ